MASVQRAGGPADILRRLARRVGTMPSSREGEHDRRRIAVEPRRDDAVMPRAERGKGALAVTRKAI